MKCPCCGSEMIKGYVVSARRILFSTEDNECLFDIKSKEDVVLSSHNWTGPTCIAYHCDKCQKVVIDYSKEAE